MPQSPSLLRNVLSNWLVLAVNLVYAFFITPIVVRTLDVELYGVWSFLNGLVAYSDLLYFGLGSALIRYVAQYHAKGDQGGINRLASVTASIYGIVGIMCLLVLVAYSRMIPAAFAKPLSPGAANAASLTCVLLGLRLLTIFIASAFAGVICGHDRFDLVNGVNLVSLVVRFVTIPLLLPLGSSPLVTLALLTVAMGIVELGVMAAIAFRFVPGLSVRPVLAHWTELRWLYGFGLQSFLILFAVKLISYTDTIVIGVTLGAASVALYTLPLQLVEYARQSVGGFAGVLLPRLVAFSEQEDGAGFRESYLKSARISCFLAGWLGGLLVSLGPPFLRAWVGPEFATSASWVLVYLSIGMFGQVLSSQVPLAFYQALHLMAVPAAVLMVEALLNLALSVWLAPRLGITGVAIATAIPALISLAILPRYLCSQLGLPLKALVVFGAGPGLAMFLVTAASELMIGRILTAESFLMIGMRALITVPLAAALISVTFPPDERQAALQILRFLRTPRPGSKPLSS